MSLYCWNIYPNIIIKTCRFFNISTYICKNPRVLPITLTLSVLSLYLFVRSYMGFCLAKKVLLYNLHVQKLLKGWLAEKVRMERQKYIYVDLVIKTKNINPGEFLGLNVIVGRGNITKAHKWLLFCLYVLYSKSLANVKKNHIKIRQTHVDSRYE